MTVGDIVWKRPEFGAAKGQQSVPPLEARVVYIHPQRRFYSVEFTFTRGGVTRSFRQAYPLRNRITASTGDVVSVPPPPYYRLPIRFFQHS